MKPRGAETSVRGRSLSRGASCYFYTIVVNELIPGIPETFTNEPPKLFFGVGALAGGFSGVSAQSSVQLQHDVIGRM